MLNQAVLMGRLVAEPELRYTQSNIPVVSFRLAVDRNYVRQGAERETDFINIVAWRSTAEFVSRYFHKGQLVAVQGSIQTRNYTDGQGNKRTAFEIVADNVYFAESKSGQSGDRGPSTYAPPVSTQPSAMSQPAAGYYASGADSDFEEIEEDSDLPF